MSYEIRLSAQVRKALRKHSRSGTFNHLIFDEVLGHLERGEPLPHKYEDHKLQFDMAGHRECHLAFDLLLVYKRNELLKMITLTKMGTHRELFGE